MPNFNMLDCPAATSKTFAIEHKIRDDHGDAMTSTLLDHILNSNTFIPLITSHIPLYRRQHI